MSAFIDAIVHCDFELAESLRGTLSDSDIDEIADAYRRLDDWPPKDIAIHLLQDYPSETTSDVMQDALRSPTPETRAAAYCVLTNDFNAFNGFLRDGFVDGRRVDAAIARMAGT